MSKNEFNKFEHHVDDEIERLKCLNFPFRSCVSNLFILINTLMSREPIDPGQESRFDAGMDLISRSSYILPYLQKCPEKPEGSSAVDAISILKEEDFLEFSALVRYGHFCEVAPYVHRGYFKVDVGEGGNIQLSYPSDDYCDVEIVDVMLAYFSMPLTIQPAINLKIHFDGFAKDLPRGDLVEHLMIYKKYFDWFFESHMDSGILGDGAADACASVSYSEFKRFQCAWMAVAEFHIQMIEALSRRIRHEGASDEVMSELFEWAAPLLNKNYLGGLIVSLSGLSSEKYQSLMGHYTCSHSNMKNVGEGFVPPIIETDIGYLFSPYILKTMLSPRNMLYSMLKTDQSGFDNLVSTHLEPKLILDAKSIFDTFDSFQTECNFSWGEGEFDLLVYSAEENAVLHVQAKAAVPPEGARMVARSEGRITEAIGQIDRFNRIDEDEKLRIVSKALNRQLKDVEYYNCVLGWANIGSKEVWDSLRASSIFPLNISLLKALRAKKATIKLSELEGDVFQLINEIVGLADPGWEQSEMAFESGRLSLPLLKLNFESIWRYRVQVEAKLKGV